MKMGLENIAETAKGAVKVARKALLAVGLATAAATGYADGKEESTPLPSGEYTQTIEVQEDSQTDNSTNDGIAIEAGVDYFPNREGLAGYGSLLVPQ